MAKHWCAASRPERPNHIVWGVGQTPGLAESDARYNVEQEVAKHPTRGPTENWTYRPFVWTKPKFKLGQKVRRKDMPSIIYKVQALPKDNPHLDGCILYESLSAKQTGVGFGFSCWANQDQFDAA